jgi:hypothetical protein
LLREKEEGEEEWKCEREGWAGGGVHALKLGGGRCLARTRCSMVGESARRARPGTRDKRGAPAPANKRDRDPSYGERACMGVGCRLGETSSTGCPPGVRRRVGLQSAADCRR